MGDVPERGPAEQGQRLRVNFKEVSSERTLGYSSTVGDLPVGGVVAGKREQIGEGKLGHGPSLGRSGDRGRRDVGRVRRPGLKSPACPELPDLFGYPQPCMVTVCGGAATTRSPRPRLEMLATQCPRLRRLSGRAAALSFHVRWASPAFPSPRCLPGGRPPVPPGRASPANRGVDSLNPVRLRERQASLAPTSVAPLPAARPHSVAPTSVAPSSGRPHLRRSTSGRPTSRRRTTSAVRSRRLRLLQPRRLRRPDVAVHPYVSHPPMAPQPHFPRAP